MASTSRARLQPALAPVPVRNPDGSLRRPRASRHPDEAPAFLVDDADGLFRHELVTTTRPDTAHVRALRVLALSGDLLAAVVIIGGGALLTGLATLF